jgi:hypothetical protein
MTFKKANERSREERLQSLRSRLRGRVLAKFEEAEKRSGKSLNDARLLIEMLGIMEVVDMLVGEQPTVPPAGFRQLMKDDLARFTLEQAMLDFADSGLLTRLQIENARSRLQSYGAGDSPVFGK